MRPGPKRLETYVTPTGRRVFEDWFSGLRDAVTRSAIRARLDRLEAGNSGDHAYVGEGVSELRIHYGPGFRVYYGEIGETVIILLCGGDKSSQSRDIKDAQNYWAEYRSRP